MIFDQVDPVVTPVASSVVLKRARRLLLDKYAGANAAYSLRALSGAWTSQPVVEVRRASDDTTADFTAAQVANGALASWVNATVALPLDTASGASAAYSLRDLTTSRVNITSNGDTGGDTQDAWVVQVRRSSDGNLKSFTAAEVADGTMETWVGTGATDQGYVSTWYDQAGTNHGTQTTIGKQPRIVVDGSQVFENSVPAIRPDGVDDTVNIPTISGDNYSVFAKYHAPSDSSLIFRNTGGNATAAGRRSNTHWYFQYDGITYDQAIDHPSTPVVANYQVIGTDMMIRGNGVDVWTPQTVTAGTNSNISRIANYLGGTGTVSEIIIYTTDQTDNRKALESNMADFYGIDLDAAADHDSGEDQVDGFVTTWYDQSGQGNDAVQTVSTSQPKIVDAGSLVTGGLDFDGTNHWLETGSAFPTGTNISAFYVANSTGSNQRVLDTRGTGGVATVQGWQLKWSNTQDLDAFDSGSGSLQTSNITRSGLGLASTIASQTSVESYTDGVLGDSVTGSIGSFDSGNPLTIGANQNGKNTQIFDGLLQEIIVYASDQSANRTGIEGNINSAYSIY
jgi:hypothetical protein